MATVKSGINKVGNNYYQSITKDNPDGSVGTTFYRVNADGSGGVPIYDVDRSPGSTELFKSFDPNATADERRFLSDPNSQLSQVRSQQVRSSNPYTNPTPLQQSALAEAGGNSGNEAPVDPNQPNVPGSSTPANPNPGEGNEPQTGSGSLIYPEDLGSSGQDRIKFQALTYSASIDSRLPGLFDGGFALNRPTFTPVGGSVFLPIQSSITDQNSVGWEPDTMNPIEARAATISSSIMKASNPSDITGAIANNFLNALKDLKKEGEAVRAYLVGQAIGVNNLQSRLLGQVLNPNLELLFQGPQLRPFTFTFKLSPRSSSEAKIVKRIINYFKKNMAPIAEDNGLFLKTPNVFKIEYQKGTSTHKSINLIKECALTNCSVDYTPLGTYMTFNDEDATMVSYTLNLQFQELEPVYSRDYKDPNQIEF